MPSTSRATEPAVGNTRWMENAACAAMADNNIDLFFPETGKKATGLVQICGVCPVRSDCLSYALRNRIEHGVWGGTTAQERVALLRARHRSSCPGCGGASIKTEVPGRIHEVQTCRGCGLSWRGGRVV